MNMLKFGYGNVLDGLHDIPEFHFFLGFGRPQTRLSSHVVFIFQKSLTVWKDICLETKHVGAHLMDQLRKNVSFEGREKKLNHSGCLLSQILFHCFVCYVHVFSFYSITPLCPYYVCSNPRHHLAFLYDRT